MADLDPIARHLYSRFTFLSHHYSGIRSTDPVALSDTVTANYDSGNQYGYFSVSPLRVLLLPLTVLSPLTSKLFESIPNE